MTPNDRPLRGGYRTHGVVPSLVVVVAVHLVVLFCYWWFEWPALIRHREILNRDYHQWCWVRSLNNRRANPCHLMDSWLNYKSFHWKSIKLRSRNTFQIYLGQQINIFTLEKRKYEDRQGQGLSAFWTLQERTHSGHLEKDLLLFWFFPIASIPV